MKNTISVPYDISLTHSKSRTVEFNGLVVKTISHLKPSGSIVLHCVLHANHGFIPWSIYTTLYLHFVKMSKPYGMGVVLVDGCGIGDGTFEPTEYQDRFTFV